MKKSTSEKNKENDKTFLNISKNKLMYYKKVLIAVIAAIAFACHCTVAPWLMLLMGPVIKGTFLAQHLHWLSMFTTLFVSVTAGILLIKTLDNKINNTEPQGVESKDYQQEIAPNHEVTIPPKQPTIIFHNFQHTSDDDSSYEQENKRTAKSTRSHLLRPRK
jgi:hypothetical protein